MLKEWVEKARLGLSLRTGVEGELCFDPDVLRIFESAPLDVLPAFEAPPGYKWPKNPRGKDHPRYGRFIYAFAKFYKPERIVAVGTDTRGAAVGCAKAPPENNPPPVI